MIEAFSYLLWFFWKQLIVKLQIHYEAYLRNIQEIVRFNLSST